MTVLPPVVSAGWLAAHLAEVTVVDVRWYLDGRSGLDAYLAGHIPGAVWLDIDTDLSAPAGPTVGRHPLPSEAAFAGALGRMGIADGQPVVAYDDGTATAARLWWLLHVLDEPVAVLDGGLAAWQQTVLEPLSTEVPIPVPVQRSVPEWPADRFRTADQVLTLLGHDDGPVLVDARAADRYANGGAVDPRPGHIPGALSRPWAQNLDADGTLLAADVLRERYAEFAARPVVAYCGSGVTACHDLLAMTLAGLDDLALYPGSWSQWAQDPPGAGEPRPTRTGSAP